jgi:hypothetical protein
VIETLDIGELVEGYQIGKAHRLAEWSARREQREFARMCNVLGCIKRRNDDRAEGGERWKHYCEVRRRIDRNPERRSKAAARKRAKKKKAYDAKPTTKCVVCEKSFARPFRKGWVPKTCSDDCKREHARRRQRASRAREVQR